MTKRRTKKLAGLLLLIAVLVPVLTSTSCEGSSTVYMGVGVSGPYGHPYGGHYGYPAYGGTVWVGRPITF
jgi:hypothetical protein